MNLFSSKCIGTAELSSAELKADKKNMLKCGSCGLGEKALYIPGIYTYYKFYACWQDTARVFKRLAVSEGGITGGGISGAVPYLVVLFQDGHERQFLIRREQDIDDLLAKLPAKHPEIKTVSENAEQRMGAAKAKYDAEHAPHTLTAAEEKSIRTLEQARSRLDEKAFLYRTLAGTAAKKKTTDRIDPRMQWISVFIFALSVIAAAVGVLLLVLGGFGHAGLWIVLAGVAGIFLSFSSHTLPFFGNSKKTVDAAWENSVQEMEKFLADGGLRAKARLRPKNEGGDEPVFPLPAAYAHPMVIDRMIRVIREGRTAEGGIDEALEVTRKDMKSLNSSVTVSENEYREVVIIKPLFIANDYR